MCNTPGFSGKKPVIEQPGVETFQRCFPQDPGKFCTLINISGLARPGFSQRVSAGLLNRQAKKMRPIWPH